MCTSHLGSTPQRPRSFVPLPLVKGPYTLDSAPLWIEPEISTQSPETVHSSLTRSPNVHPYARWHWLGSNSPPRRSNVFKKFVASLATLLLAVGMSVVAIAAPASAAPPGGGTYPPTDAAANEPGNWVVLTGEECDKIDPVNAVPYPLPSPGAGRQFSKVIVKAGSGDGSNLILTDGLAEGTLVRHNIKDSISHLILCTVPTPVDLIPTDASASVTTTPATCEAAEGDVMVTAVNATSVITYPTETTYEVVATADANHLFADGEVVDGGTVSEDHKTKTFTGALDSRLTDGCSDQPVLKCLPASAVSYTYIGSSNSGNITVVNPDSSKYTNDLCEGFWVTATSWKYTTNQVWPQTLDRLDYVNGKQKITAVGAYPFQAVMTCGQGDIYASFDEQPEPTPTLTAPNTPYAENFLHQMGFIGPNGPNGPRVLTYFQQPTGCYTAPGVASATVTTTPATCSASESGVVVTVINATSKVTFPTDTTYRVTATATGNNVFSNEKSTLEIAGEFAPRLVEGCELPPLALVTPTYLVTQPSCTTAGSYTLGSDGGDVVWTVNGKTSVVSGTYSAPVDFSKVTISAAPVDEESTLYDWVNPVVLTFTPPIGCVEIPPASGVASASVTTTAATCSAAESGVVVTVTNAIFALIYPTETTYRVVATATGSNLFANEESTLVIKGTLKPKLTDGCELPSLALVTPKYSVTQPTCTAAGSYTLDSVVGDIVWTVNGKTGVASGKYPAPSDFSDVTISATPAVAGDGLDPDWVNPVVLKFAAPSTSCSFNPPTLSFDPPTLAYTGLTVGTGLSLAGGLLFVGFAGLVIARRRKLQG